MPTLQKQMDDVKAQVKDLKSVFEEGLDKLKDAFKGSGIKGGGSSGGGGDDSGGGGVSSIPIGHYIGFYCAKWGKYLRMHKDGQIDASGMDGKGDPGDGPAQLAAKFPKYWGWEKFWTKDLGGGKTAYYNGSLGKFMNANANGRDMGSSSHGSAKGEKLGGWEPFTAIPVGDGKFKLKGHKGKFVRMPQNGNAKQGDGPEDEITFTVVDLGEAPPPPTPREQRKSGG
eukprot:gnl/MRDRNA2_/MRDRNA2_95054_c0_seq2.p1 gnl/MRDRNA2_/MRDRNA2_95054_c0~~gnl/MRDRNA2_/MRDRNA2_95054_c0_seq2.p1  ORF type:complete len:251 (-),score=76.18 gnl/MRDRNA2_/MRDRNA2_95054_c0_seq2:318-998(-)